MDAIFFVCGQLKKRLKMTVRIHCTITRSYCYVLDSVARSVCLYFDIHMYSMRVISSLVIVAVCTPRTVTLEWSDRKAFH